MLISHILYVSSYIGCFWTLSLGKSLIPRSKSHWRYIIAFASDYKYISWALISFLVIPVDNYLAFNKWCYQYWWLLESLICEKLWGDMWLNWRECHLVFCFRKTKSLVLKVYYSCLDKNQSRCQLKVFSRCNWHS